MLFSTRWCQLHSENIFHHWICAALTVEQLCSDVKLTQSCSNSRSIKTFSSLQYPYETMIFQGDFLGTLEIKHLTRLTYAHVVPWITKLLPVRWCLHKSSGSQGNRAGSHLSWVKFWIGTPEREICWTASQRAPNPSIPTMHTLKELHLPFQDKGRNWYVTAEHDSDWHLVLQPNLIYIWKGLSKC